jgi:hypothetical protein
MKPAASANLNKRLAPIKKGNDVIVIAFFNTAGGYADLGRITGQQVLV